MATYWSCYDYLLELHDMPGGQCGIVYMGVLLKYVGVYMWVWIRHSAMHWDEVVLSLNIFTA